MLSGASRLSLSKSTKSKRTFSVVYGESGVFSKRIIKPIFVGFDDFEYAQLRISTASAMRKFYHTPRRVIQYYTK